MANYGAAQRRAAYRKVEAANRHRMYHTPVGDFADSELWYVVHYLQNDVQAAHRATVTLGGDGPAATLAKARARLLAVAAEQARRRAVQS